MASVWAIEEGNYSDYHVVGVFSTREAAELVLKAITAKDANGEPISYGDPAIAEWQLDPVVNELRAGLTLYRVLMLRDGTVELCEKSETSSYAIGDRIHIWRRSTAPFYRGTGVQDALDGRWWATDEAHAIKSANEHRARLIATGEWS